MFCLFPVAGARGPGEKRLIVAGSAPAVTGHRPPLFGAVCFTKGRSSKRDVNRYCDLRCLHPSRPSRAPPRPSPPRDPLSPLESTIVQQVPASSDNDVDDQLDGAVGPGPGVRVPELSAHDDTHRLSDLCDCSGWAAHLHAAGDSPEAFLGGLGDGPGLGMRNPALLDRRAWEVG